MKVNLNFWKKDEKSKIPTPISTSFNEAQKLNRKREVVSKLLARIQTWEITDDPNTVIETPGQKHHFQSLKGWQLSDQRVIEIYDGLKQLKKELNLKLK